MKMHSKLLGLVTEPVFIPYLITTTLRRLGWFLKDLDMFGQKARAFDDEYGNRFECYFSWGDRDTSSLKIMVTGGMEAKTCDAECEMIIVDLAMELKDTEKSFRDFCLSLPQSEPEQNDAAPPFQASTELSDSELWKDVRKLPCSAA